MIKGASSFGYASNGRSTFRSLFLCVKELDRDAETTFSDLEEK